MPLAAVTAVKLGVTVSPPATALFSVTVKVSESPSLADASMTVTVAAPSSSMIVPTPVSVAVTGNDVAEACRLTVNVLFVPWLAFPVVATAKVCVSPAAPAKVRAAVFAV